MTIEQSQKIYQEIGRLLYSIMPEEAAKIQYTAAYHKQYRQAGAEWFRHNGEIVYFDEHPYPVYREIDEQLMKLQQLDIFQSSPWNHCHITMTDKGQFKTRFAWVHDDDACADVYMRGLSELSLEEARQAYYPQDLWVEFLQRALPRHKRELEEARQVGDQKLAEELQGKISRIEDNLAKYG